MDAYRHAAYIRGGPIMLNLGSSGNCEPERFNDGVQVVFDVRVDGAPVVATLNYDYFKIESGRSRLAGSVFLPPDIVGSDGDLDVTGSITLLDAAGESVAELILDNEVAVNGFDPVLPPVPDPAAETCLLDSSDVPIFQGSVFDATAHYWIEGPAPATVSTIHVEAPSSCGEELFAAWERPGREVVPRVYLAIGSDRLGHHRSRNPLLRLSAATRGDGAWAAVVLSTRKRTLPDLKKPYAGERVSHLPDGTWPWKAVPRPE